ncbi:hypothetical protein JAO73_14485 [Hymenobacter sp. BT523]|uniref:hypothetical protein n=1 Tax=Hymenobacter sp. BT523 TaxID=2795725 RepID=UPI0018EE1790|nr:hypothetical protein [Hymenobacter sp. BT523]MBJ6110227.1 hypothetical protein [Hymenobacter sp. BT523]
MKPLLTLLLPLLLKLAAVGPPTGKVTFSPLTKAAYLEARKAAIVTKPVATFPLKKQKGCIVIPTVKGKVIFQDKGVGTDNDDQAEFSYRGLVASLKYHVVEGRYWEAFQVHLVGENGQRLDLPSLPEYSPDMRSMVVASSGIEVGYFPNAIQLYRLENGRWRQVWKIEPSVDPMSWEPEEVRWLSNSALLLKKKMWTGKKPGTTYTYAKLQVH